MQSSLRQVKNRAVYHENVRKNRDSDRKQQSLDSAGQGSYNTPCAAKIGMRTMEYGGVAQLARAFGSYPECHLFESDRRYH